MAYRPVISIIMRFFETANRAERVDLSPNSNKRILLGQLVSNGDCLYATAIARQIKEDFPDCHLTWAIGSNCCAILDGNPHVDEIWEIPLADSREGISEEVWQKFEREANARKNEGRFDEVFFTQIVPGNLQNHDGCVRSSIFRGYPNPITVSVAPVLRLSPDEVENVARFAASHRLIEYTNVILFECSPQSEQSFVTPAFAFEAARLIVAAMPDVCVILSSHQSFNSSDKHIIDGSVLTLRETAELTKNCSLLIGCSSGVSWITTSDWAKPLPMIQLPKPDLFHCNSFINDFTRWSLGTDSVLEMTDCSPDKLLQCVGVIFQSDFGSAKLKFQQRVPIRFSPYFAMQRTLLRQGKYRGALRSVLYNIRSNGHSPKFIQWHVAAWVTHLCPWMLVIALEVKKSIQALRNKKRD